MGAVAGLTAAGCGSSSGGGSADAGGDASDDGGDAGPCSPQPVVVPDAGACGACVAMMCNSALMECNADCTCGGSVNQIAGCLADLPPVAADGGGLGSLLGSAGLQLVTCVGGSALGGGGGILGGGGAGGASTAMSDYLTCLLTSCTQPCFGVGGDGGPEAGPTPPDAGDSGSPEAGSDTGSPDSAVDSSSADTGLVDAPVDAPIEASVDAPVESSTDAPSE